MSTTLCPGLPLAAVTFDVGGTLIEPWPSVGQLYAEVAAEFGLETLSDSLNAAFSTAWKARPAHDYSRAAWQSLANDTFTAAGAPQPSDECFDALYRRFAEASAWRVFDDARPALTALAARGLALGVISNWDERLRPLLAALDLARHFRVVIVSCEVGCTKPAREVFLRTAGELRCDPGSVLHVGDRDREDVAGAAAAGFRAVPLDRSHRSRRREEADSAGLASNPPNRNAGAPFSDAARNRPLAETRRVGDRRSGGLGSGGDGVGSPDIGCWDVISSLDALPGALETGAARRPSD